MRGYEHLVAQDLQGIAVRIQGISDRNEDVLRAVAVHVDNRPFS